MRTILAMVLAGAALALAAGCGGSSNDTAAATTEPQPTTVATTESTDTTSTDTASADTTSVDTTAAGAAAAAGLSAGCQKVADLSVQFGKALGAAGATGSASGDLDKTAKAYEEFAKQVPEEIRGSFETLAQAFGQYAKALQGVDLSSGKTPDAATIGKLAQAAQALDNEALSAANSKITAWVQKNCNTGG